MSETLCRLKKSPKTPPQNSIFSLLIYWYLVFLFNLLLWYLERVCAAWCPLNCKGFSQIPKCFHSCWRNVQWNLPPDASKSFGNCLPLHFKMKFHGFFFSFCQLCRLSGSGFDMLASFGREQECLWSDAWVAPHISTPGKVFHRQNTVPLFPQNRIFHQITVNSMMFHV